MAEYRYSIYRVDLTEDKYVVSKDQSFGDKDVWTCIVYIVTLLCLRITTLVIDVHCDWPKEDL